MKRLIIAIAALAMLAACTSPDTNPHVNSTSQQQVQHSVRPMDGSGGGPTKCTATNTCPNVVATPVQ